MCNRCAETDIYVTSPGFFYLDTTNIAVYIETIKLHVLVRRPKSFRTPGLGNKLSRHHFPGIMPVAWYKDQKWKSQQRWSWLCNKVQNWMVFEPVITDETQILRCKTRGGRCVIYSLSKCVNLTLLRFKSCVCVAVPVSQYLYPTRQECVSTSCLDVPRNIQGEWSHHGRHGSNTNGCTAG